jgi:hypothetical protein
VDSGAHRRASAGGDDGHGGAALSCARANAREEGVHGTRRRLGCLAWARRVASCPACSAGRGGARRVYAGAALLPWRGRRARSEARGHLAGCGGGRHHASWAHGVSVRPKVRWPGWERRGVPTSRRRGQSAQARSTFQSSPVQLDQTMKS